MWGGRRGGRLLPRVSPGTVSSARKTGIFSRDDINFGASIAGRRFPVHVKDLTLETGTGKRWWLLRWLRKGGEGKSCCHRAIDATGISKEGHDAMLGPGTSERERS